VKPSRIHLVAIAAAVAAMAPLQASAAPTGTAADNPGGSGWSAGANAYRGRNTERFVYTCPKYGTIGSVWGTDIYTDDSSVCTAAVHTGNISLAGGGTVTIEIRPGQPSYAGTTRNRITTNSYSTYSGSFVIVAATPENPGVGAGGNGWSATATPFRNWVGAQFQFDCPPNGGTSYKLWGTFLYSDDSNPCFAGVHVGLITLKSGGKVTVEMRPGELTYKGSKRHGLLSRQYGQWVGSFVVVGAPEGPDTPQGTATGDVFVNGAPFTDGAVPYGSTVDVTRGTLALTAPQVGSILVYGDGTDLAKFSLKRAVEKAGSKKRKLAEMALAGGDFKSCAATPGSARAAAGNEKVVEALWSDGKGRFRTKGRFSSASIRGTIWQTADRCDGTLTTVKLGTVLVRDFVKKKDVTVGAGTSYLATGP
jgi:hypothetical protein